MQHQSLSTRIQRAFVHTTRSDFMPHSELYRASLDAPSPIGHGQTISQPTTVSHMLNWLAPDLGHRVLDVGSGSGWSSALLSFLVGGSGEVFACERISELKCFGEENCARFGCHNIQFFNCEDLSSLSEYAPFDRILVSAAAQSEIPQELVEQLTPQGKLVVPVNNSIFELKKDAAGQLEYCHEHPGYVFVPLIY